MLRRRGPVIDVVASQGFPLGQPVLRFQAKPRLGDIACEVVGGNGELIGLIRARSKIPEYFGRETRTLEFALLRPSGAAALTFTRIGGGTRHHNLVVQDGGGAHLGRLRQISAPGRLWRTPRLSMALEYGSELLGLTEVCVLPSDTAAIVTVPVRTESGHVLAVVERRCREDGHFFDYELDCPVPVAPPLPDLLAATGFAHHFYDRIAIGPPADSQPKSFWT
ncbi:DUF2510 domain-containing protein [Mycobacterium manitobense]|uniref:DUF2510 domain-containing protein n=1 Tax=[Mycobacterium] manitobense TaxID=190147 RepID=A0A9X3BXS2_9MYCO|nr:DUF2510 domain-containing protein [[Mycobacterium] manitobense]MCV7171542.1 DUF2510 domain-containing protein [[Mycobacterium] manitobense]